MFKAFQHVLAQVATASPTAGNFWELIDVNLARADLLDCLPLNAKLFCGCVVVDAWT